MEFLLGCCLNHEGNNQDTACSSPPLDFFQVWVIRDIFALFWSKNSGWSKSLIEEMGRKFSGTINLFLFIFVMYILIMYF